MSSSEAEEKPTKKKSKASPSKKPPSESAPAKPKKEKVDPAAGTKDIRSFFVSLYPLTYAVGDVEKACAVGCGVEECLEGGREAGRREREGGMWSGELVASLKRDLWRDTERGKCNGILHDGSMEPIELILHRDVVSSSRRYSWGEGELEEGKEINPPPFHPPSLHL